MNFETKYKNYISELIQKLQKDNIAQSIIVKILTIAENEKNSLLKSSNSDNDKFDYFKKHFANILIKEGFATILKYLIP